MAERRLTSFEHIVLGLICIEPSSGYDLKRMFAVTPMGVYQPSSGTLYPALRRLELIGMIQTQTPSGQNGSSARHRRVYEPTQAGRAAHEAWLRAPVEPATVASDLGLHLMRFVMMESLFPAEEVVGFLRSFADALATRSQYRRSSGTLARSQTLAPRSPGRTLHSTGRTRTPWPRLIATASATKAVMRRG